MNGAGRAGTIYLHLCAIFLSMCLSIFDMCLSNVLNVFNAKTMTEKHNIC